VYILHQSLKTKCQRLGETRVVVCVVGQLEVEPTTRRLC